MNSRHSAGFTLMEALIGIVLMSLVLAALVQLLRAKELHSWSDRVTRVRNDLGLTIQKLARSPHHLADAARKAENSILKSCLSNNPAERESCPGRLGANQLAPLTLVNSKGEAVTGPASGNVGADFTPQNGAPVYYDINGNRCSQVSGQCGIEVLSAFRLACNPSCDSIQVFFWVRRANDPRASHFASMPPLHNLNDAIAVLVADINDASQKPPPASGTPAPDRCITVTRQIIKGVSPVNSYWDSWYEYTACPDTHPLLIGGRVVPPCRAHWWWSQWEMPRGYPSAISCSLNFVDTWTAHRDPAPHIAACQASSDPRNKQLYSGTCEAVCCDL